MSMPIFPYYFVNYMTKCHYIQRIKVLQVGGVLAKAQVKRQRWSALHAPPT
ncbi:hypothetical protein [Sporomusa acidovorans]|uniref:hypothetical protein n=1 Tax=Sporomusa acidovorans TaxID=112900 RepID=UPI0015A24CD5|nr:hypothetical protein [Sporomusa acidovorans]